MSILPGFTLHESRPGLARLGVRQVRGQSSIVEASARAPSKLLLPRARGLAVWAFLSSFGGGLVAGDEINFQISVEEKARCFISTQASTKIYRNPAALPCSSFVEARIAEGALLVLAPDPVQAFSGSSYIQKQTFSLHKDANLVLVDWFSAGRSACGERWAFDSLRSSNEVFVDSKRAFLDSIHLDPKQVGHLMGEYNCMATVLIMGPLFREMIKNLVSSVHSEPMTKRPALIKSASLFGIDSMVLRIAGIGVQAVGREIHQSLQFLSGLLADDPWSRKW
jgi:urease accessory protein